MARKPRIHYPGALYHVIIRGNNRESVLQEENHKIKYLNILSLYKGKMDFILYAYCIMDNHVHLLIEVNDIPLSQIMQRIQQVYTQWFNRKYERTGHVFQQRYKALLCDRENYLLQLVRYIHNNPVKAFVDDGLEYIWSSHLCYIGKQQNDIVETSKILSMFSKDKDRALKSYLQFMNQEEKEITYIDEDEFLPTNLICEKEIGDRVEKFNIDDIIEEVCINEDVTINDITKRTRVQRISDIRKAIVILCVKYCDVTNKILTHKINLTSSMISKIKSGGSKGTAYVEEVIKRWEENK